MADDSVHTAQLHGWLIRMKAGDPAAREELLRGLAGRLEHLTRKMLRRFPNVRRWADTNDVLQNALLRLLRALEAVHPGSMREFFGLAAEQIRRELLDLARHFYGPLGHGANLAGQAPWGPASSGTEEPADPADDADDLERWCCFHESVAGLPAEEREVVGLVFYHGWGQAEVANLMGVSERTVQRRWHSALLKLRHIVREDDPAREGP